MTRSPSTQHWRGSLPWPVLGLGFVLLVLSLAAIVLRVTTIGSDGTSTENRASAYHAGSLEVFADTTNQGPLRSGDRIFAVDGVPMTTLAERVFDFGADRPAWRSGQVVTYAIERNGRAQTVTLTLQPAPVLATLQTRWGLLTFVLVSQLLATWLLLRRPHIPAAHLFFVWAMLGSEIYVWTFPIQVGDFVTGYGFWWGRVWVSTLAVFFYPALTHFTLLYPKPAAILRHRRWLLPALYGGALLLTAVIVFSGYRTSPTVLAAIGASARSIYAGAIIFLVLALVVAVLQYRSSPTGPERERAQWSLFGGMIAVVAGLVIGVLIPMIAGRNLVDVNVYGLVLLAFPVSMTIAMWRYHLFDIDVIIRKTILYAIVTTILAALYIGLIISLEAILGQFTGQSSRTAVALATAAIMLLFIPVRQRVQRWIDRSFSRTNYDADSLVARFGTQCRDESDLPTLLADLEAVIQTSLQPAHVGVWLVRRDSAQPTLEAPPAAIVQLSSMQLSSGQPNPTSAATGQLPENHLQDGQAADGQLTRSGLVLDSAQQPEPVH